MVAQGGLDAERPPRSGCVMKVRFKEPSFFRPQSVQKHKVLDSRRACDLQPSSSGGF